MQRRRTPGPLGGGLECIGPYGEINESQSRHRLGGNKRIGEKTFPRESRVVRSETWTRGMCVVQVRASENDAVVALCALDPFDDETPEDRTTRGQAFHDNCHI